MSMGTNRELAEKFLDLVIEAWATNDGTTVASLFVDDGSLINPFGDRADGRAAIGAMYSEFFGGMLRGTTTSFELGTVRTVGTDHAFVDGEQTISGPDHGVVLVAHIAALLRREGDTWRFVDARPYTFPEVPPG
jgi:uncharacterized protein (TIGR02246 family)